MKDLAAGDHQAGPGLAQGSDRDHAAVLAGDGGGPFDGARFMTSGMARVAATSSPFFTRVWLCRVAHMTSSTMLKAASAGGVDRKQTVDGRLQTDLAFLGIVLPGNTFAGQSLGQNRGRLVFMDFVIFQIDQVEVIFAEFLQMAEVFIADRVALAESRDP